MKITFCINTAKNERQHLELLFRSLAKNLSRKDHDILVYVENDNQDTTSFLVTQKQHFPNLRIIKNPLPIPLGYSRNINLMFEMAQTDVVSYLQSDMIICKDYDDEILKYLTPDTIISATRIEPPLHPPSPEKITYDFGLDPKTFILDDFTTFAEANKSLHQTDFWFAPFTLYKKNWVEIGGHDTLFRRSREDSDLLYRFSMKGLKIKQIWNALVYHFTCISSRGIEWWTEKFQARTRLQSIADIIEMQRFLRKWPTFKHTTTFDPLKEYKYHASINFKNVTPLDGVVIFQNYYRFDKIYIDNEVVRNNLIKEYDKLHIPANNLLDITPPLWEIYKKYYRTWEGKDIFVNKPLETEDVIMDIDYQSMNVFSDNVLLNLNDILHQQSNQDGPGTYQWGKGYLTINTFPIPNRIQENVAVKNPSLDSVELIYL
jgi:GT2 family glycosyltransferase